MQTTQATVLYEFSRPARSITKLLLMYVLITLESIELLELPVHRRQRNIING